MSRKQRRTATIDIGRGETITLRPLRSQDMQRLYFCFSGLFDALVEAHRKGTLDVALEKLWPCMVPALCSAVALAAGEEASDVADLPLTVLVEAVMKLAELTFPPSSPAGDMLPVSSKSLLPFSQVLAQLGAAKNFPPSRTQ